MANIPLANIPNAPTAMGQSPMAPASAVRMPRIQTMPVLGREVFDGSGAGAVALSRGVWEGANQLNQFASAMSKVNDAAQFAEADRVFEEAKAAHAVETTKLPESEWAKVWQEKYAPKLENQIRGMRVSMEAAPRLQSWWAGKNTGMVGGINVEANKNFINRTSRAKQEQIERAVINEDYDSAFALIKQGQDEMLWDDAAAMDMENKVTQANKETTTKRMWENLDTEMMQQVGSKSAEEIDAIEADLRNAVESGSLKSEYYQELNDSPADLKKALRNFESLKRDETMRRHDEAAIAVVEGRYGTIDELREDLGDRFDTIGMAKVEQMFNQSPEEQAKRIAQRPALVTAIDMYDPVTDTNSQEFDRLLGWIHSMPAGYQADLSQMLRDKKKDAKPKPSSALQAIKDRERQLFEQGTYGPIKDEDQWQAAKALQSRVIDKLDSWARANPQQAADALEVSKKHNEIKTQIYVEDMADDNKSNMTKPQPVDPADLSRRILKDPRMNPRADARMQEDTTLDDVQLPLGDGSWRVTDKTRDEIRGGSRVGQRQISLDFNDLGDTGRRVEIVIPYNATKEERAAAKAYVQRTVEFYRSKGIDMPDGQVLTRTGKGKAVSRFHTEPFNGKDKEAYEAVRDNPDEYASILEDTLGRVANVTFIAPHRSNDGGAQNDETNERDFARNYLIPALQRRKGESQTARND